jgi:hypothetical protein
MRRVLLLMSALIATRAAAQPPDTAGRAPESRRGKLIAAASVGAIHAAYATWSYFAWYRGRDPEAFHVETDPAFGVHSYAGGADKFGHAWSNYALTRGTTAVLTAGGWPRLQSSLVSAGLTEIAFTLTEIQDGYVWGFDPHDMIANATGATLALVMENVPAVDRLFDFRLQYFPSRDYRRTLRENGSVDVGQDYTGQSYILALHVGALPRMEDSDYTYWSRFVDLAVGFEAHHYSPAPDPPQLQRQTFYLGLAVNMQGVLNAVFDDSRGRRIGRGIFEVYSLPYTTFRYAESSRNPPLAPM